jgi:hypothetical protein
VHVVFLPACYQEELHRMGLVKMNGSPVLEEWVEIYDRILYWDEGLWHVEVLVNLCAEVLERLSASSRSDLHLCLLDESPSEKACFVEEH